MILKNIVTIRTYIPIRTYKIIRTLIARRGLEMQRKFYYQINSTRIFTVSSSSHRFLVNFLFDKLVNLHLFCRSPPPRQAHLWAHTLPLRDRDTEYSTVPEDCMVTDYSESLLALVIHVAHNGIFCPSSLH